MKRVNLQVEKQPGEKNFSCFMVDDIPGFGLQGYGKSVREAIDDLYATRDEMKSIFETQGRQFPDLEFSFRYDMGSFFDAHPYLNITAIAKKAGINDALMRQYVIGKKKPRQKRIEQIMDCLHIIDSEIKT